MCFDPFSIQSVSVIVFYCCHACHTTCLADFTYTNSNKVSVVDLGCCTPSTTPTVPSYGGKIEGARLKENTEQKIIRRKDNFIHPPKHHYSPIYIPSQLSKTVKTVLGQKEIKTEINRAIRMPRTTDVTECIFPRFLSNFDPSNYTNHTKRLNYPLPLLIP